MVVVLGRKENDLQEASMISSNCGKEAPTAPDNALGRAAEPNARKKTSLPTLIPYRKGEKWGFCDLSLIHI